jgi:hypothetical protein
MHAKNLRGTRGAAMLVALSLLGGAPASQADPANRVWDWTYTGTDIKAEGTITTEATPDSNGFYRIVGIAGQRNGAAITRLWPQGTAIPGNEPYSVDNRIKLSAPQLTKAGFGFALADGSYSNPFYADFKSPPTYLDFHSQPPSGPTELPITFTAKPR